VAAYGQTAAARRRSRVELWQNNCCLSRYQLPQPQAPHLFGLALSIAPEDRESLPTAIVPGRIAPSACPIRSTSSGPIESPTTPRTPFVPKSSFFPFTPVHPCLPSRD